MSAHGRSFWLAACALALTIVPAAQSLDRRPGPAPPAPSTSTSTQRTAVNGVVVDFSMQHVDATRASDHFREGDDVRLRFALSDARGAPLPKAKPAAWMERRAGTEQPEPPCKAKIQELLSGSLFHRAELDLNSYYVLALNGDATITVVDPLFGFGQTRLLALVTLKSTGEDWAVTDDQGRLFVSMPASNQVAVVDTTSWQVSTNVDVGPRPTRLALQPDQQYLWVSYEGDASPSDDGGVAIFETAGLKLAGRVPTGRGPHEIAISHDNRFAVVTNRESGTASLIDIRRLTKIADIPTGAGPTSVAFSPLSGLAYIANADAGAIVAVDPGRGTVVARMAAQPGLKQIRFARGGRFGFAVNPARDEISVVDASVNRIIQTGHLDEGPDQLGFSDDLVYVLHRGSEIVRMIPLAEIGQEGQPLQVADFPGGEAPFGRGALPSAAASIAEAPGGGAVLIANPADQAIYFYKEGMAAPMGHFKNYSREPRAVLVVDRSLREHAPGVYETAVTLRRPGAYDVAFFLDSPQVVHCFPVTVETNPDSSAPAPGPGLEVVGPTVPAAIRAGQRTAVRFRVIDPVTRQPVSGRGDVRVMAVLAPGLWQDRARARALDDGGYEAELTPPRAGVYALYVECRSCGVSFRQSQPLVLQVAALDEGAQAPSHAHHTHAADAAADATDGAVPALSIPDVSVVDQEGRQVRFYSDLVKGRIVAINAIFTTCTTICPPMGATFANLQKRLGPDGERASLISISVDPVTDTPARLKTWAARFDARPGWTLVTGAKPDVDRLLKALGMFSASPSEHAPVTVIGNDARGEWTRTYGLTSATKLAELIAPWLRP